MNNKEYDKLVKSIVKNESPSKNITIAFITGGMMGVIGQILYELFLHYCNVTSSDAYLYVFIVLVVTGALLTGLGFFDKILSFCKCGMIVPSTGFANAMTSAAMDYKKEGYVKGIGGNIFKLTGSIILQGIIFGIIFGFIRSYFVWHIILIMFI